MLRRLRLGALAVLLAACAVPTASAPTVAPTEPATATPRPPTEAVPLSEVNSGSTATSPTQPSNEPVPATSIALSHPSDTAFDDEGNLYVAQCADVDIQFGAQVYKVDTFGQLTAYASERWGLHAGDGGPALTASIACAAGLAFDREGNLLIADCGNHRIRRVDRNGMISTVAGSGPSDNGGFSGDGGPATSARMAFACDVAVDTEGNLYILDLNNHRIRKVDQDGIISTFAGSGVQGFSGDGGPATSAALDFGQPDIFGSPQIAFDAEDNLYIADIGNGRVRRVDRQGVITTVAGTDGPALTGEGGPATAAVIGNPIGLAFDGDGNLYIGVGPAVLGTINDSRILKVDRNGIITNFAGNGILDFSGDGGQATSAAIRRPWGLTADRAGNLYLADAGNSRIRQVDSKGIITTIAGGKP